MKKKAIIISTILIILPIGLFGIYHNESNKVKLFESIDWQSVSEFGISSYDGVYGTKDEKHISEIMNYLKEIKFSKADNNSVNSESPDAFISLLDKNGHSILGMKIYGDVARLLPDQEDAYIVSDISYEKLNKLCDKY